MWPVNAKNCISLLKTFKPSDAQEKLHNKEKEPTLPILPHIQSTSSMNVEIGLQTCQKKIQQEMLWSDPARSKQFESFFNDTKIVCTQATFDDVFILRYVTDRRAAHAGKAI